MALTNEILKKANNQFREFVGKFGYFLSGQWKPEDIINAITKDSDKTGYTTDDREIADSTLIDIDYKSLCVTMYCENGVCQISNWVEVWDDEGAFLGCINDGKAV